MAEISLWKAIKACIIILLIVIVLKKILKVWRQHKKEMKLIDDKAYANQIHQQEMDVKSAQGSTFNNVTNTLGQVATTALGPTSYSNPQSIGQPQADGNAQENPMYGGFYGGYDEDDGFQIGPMGGGSFFDVLSKVKRGGSKKKKTTKKPSTKKKSTKKTSSKKKGKR